MGWCETKVRLPGRSCTFLGEIDRGGFLVFRARYVVSLTCVHAETSFHLLVRPTTQEVTMRYLKATSLLAAAIAMAIIGHSAALADPTHVETDRTENQLSFSYDSSEGEIGSQGSRSLSDRDEPVRFTVAVQEGEGSGAGLIGKLKLRLEGNSKTVYDGWFTLVVTDHEGDVAFQRSRPAHIVLTPRPGMRRAKVTYRFDLPSGSYSAEGSFEKR
jgi:hypothetical protein